MAEKTQGDGGWTDWIIDRVLRVLIAALLIVPYRPRIRMMGWAVRRVLAPLARYEKRAIAHLDYTDPDMSEAEKQWIAQQVSDNAGRTLIENYSSPGFARRIAATEIRGQGLAAVEDAKARGQGVIFVTGHFGNYEAPRNALHARSIEVGGLYRPMSNPFFNSHYVKTMEKVSGPIFEQGRRGTMGFARHIKSGGMAVLFFDLWDRGGTVIPFLGKPAPTSTSAAEMALKFDALLVPYFGVRQANGLDFDVYIEEPIAPSDPETMTRQMTERLEARITENPEQWFWFHRRWKPHRKV
ncbi:MAG: lysophospholipid acyltransferase family protein [Paracoccaceae bacterium]|nr:lysophospholipid acyltransferase family protein [Paracoccaceae bacterium]MDG2451314.1 lysophospholipid acyltransferase family protein [Paracoccaceae bacterium]